MVTRRTLLRTTVAGLVASLALTGVLFELPQPRLEAPRGATASRGPREVPLPPPRLDSGFSLERALVERRSLREYTGTPVTLEELGQVLWSAQGISETRHGFRTSPSAGATYPLELYAVVKPGGVRLPGGGFLEPGSYKYVVGRHSLRMVKKGDLSQELYRACVDQEWVLRAPVNLVFTAVFERTTGRYGQRGVRYVWMEVGHAGQNVYLQATALGLATVAIGAFYDDWLHRIIGAPPEEQPLYVMTLAAPSRRPPPPSPGELLRFWGRGGGG